MAGRVCFFGWVLPGKVNLGLAMDALDSRAVVCTGDQIPCECECAFAPWISKRKEVLHLGFHAQGKLPGINSDSMR